MIGLREHAVQSNPVSEGSKAFDPNIRKYRYAINTAEDILAERVFFCFFNLKNQKHTCDER